MLGGNVLQKQHGLVALVEKQVEDGEIGLETIFLLINLIIRGRRKGGVGEGMLRTDDGAEVLRRIVYLLWLGDERCGQLYLGLYVEQLTHRLSDGHVEVEKEIPPFLKERVQVIGIELEERALAIGRLQGLPVEMTPGAMVGDAHIFHLRLVDTQPLWALHRDSEGLQALGGGDDAAVAVSLFEKVVVLLYETRVIAVQLLIPLYRAEIGSGE